MSIASRIEAIEQHLTDDYNVLEVAGADLTNVDKNILNLKPTWKERLLYFMNNGTDVVWNNWDKVTGEGTSISLNNTLEAKMGIELKGNTYQNTTTGKNLCSNATYFNENAIYMYLNPKKLAKTYTISLIAPKTLANVGVYLWVDGTNLGRLTYIQYTANQRASVSHTLSDSNYSTVQNGTNAFFSLYYSGAGMDTTKSVEEAQIENNASFTSYEPYTNGASPNPDYPQPIQVVSGDNSIVVCGKNLAYTGWAENFVSRINNSNHATIETFDNRNCLKWKENVGYGDYDNKYIFKINWKENTQYTFSFDLYTNSTNNFGNLCIAYTDGTITEINGIYNQWTHKIQTSTSGKTIKYLRANWRTGYSYVDLDTFMVYEGTETLPYEPYQSQSYPINLGSIELCKIGDYQDTIVKDSDKWYLHKEIGKVVLNGSENISIYNQNTNRTNFQVDVLTGIENYLGNYDVPNLLSNMFNVVSQSATWKVGNISRRKEAQTTLYLSYEPSTTIDQFKAWLSTHNVNVYYIYATPTNTEITDANLISQLNALESALSKDGQTNISQVNNDLPFIISATALEEMS